MAIYIEPPERMLGVLPIEHYVWSPVWPQRKNAADDVHLTTRCTAGEN
jgi:hypothetical protein